MPQAATYNRSVDASSSMPARIRRLPISPQGFPVPWFVCWFDGDLPSEPGHGVPDFRVADTRKMVRAVKNGLCWTCGEPMGANKAHILGSMCVITKTISEPPSHRDCAIWSARNCPFLSKPKMVRNEKGMYAEDGTLLRGLNEAAGIGLKRNPGAVAVWITKEPTHPFKPPGGGMLFSVGRPTECLWFAEGREATRAEVMASISSGYPALENLAREEGPDAMAALEAQKQVALAMVPD